VGAMRRALFSCALIVLCVPAAALSWPKADDDGTLVVKNGTGIVSIVARGTLIGSCDSCSVTIVDPNPDDGAAPVVSNWDLRETLSEVRTRWTGFDMRFRAVGGFIRAVIRGRGIDLSVVAHGQGWIKGDDGSGVDGTYSLDGADRRSLPDDRVDFWLGTPPGLTG
jgi:hypothetical protein